MTTLVAGHGNSIRIFLYGTIYHILHATVMTQVYYLGAVGLHNAAHDINRSIMAIEKGGCCDDTDLMFRLVTHNYAIVEANLGQTRSVRIDSLIGILAHRHIA